MGGTTDVQSQFEQLLPEEQEEILDFIAFLKARREQRTPPRRSRPIPIEKEPFVGMWEGREDLFDSGRWVREIRKSEWGG